MALTSYTRLSALVAAIADDAGQNAGTAPQSGFTFIGEIEAAKRAGPPRVVWLVGGGQITDPTQQESPLSMIAYQRNPQCTVKFLGDSYDTAEGLMLDFLAAMYRTQGPTVVPGSEEHSVETIAGSARYEIRLALTVKIPVPYETFEPAQVDTVGQTGSVSE